MNKDILWNLIDSNRMYEKEREFWLSQFDTETDFSKFCNDFQSGTVSTEILQIPIREDLCEELLSMCKNSDTALYSVFFASVIYVAGRFTDTKELLVGMPALKSGQAEQPVNRTLPVKIDIGNTVPVKQYLNQVMGKIKEALKHSQYPVERILSQKGLDLEDITYGPYRIIIGSEKVNIKINQTELADQTIFKLVQAENGLSIRVLYNNNVFAEKSVRHWADKTILVLSQMVSLNEKPLSEINWLDDDERKILDKFNDTKVQFPSHRLVHSYFEEQAEKTPDRCAVIFSGQRSSYREINEKSNQLARQLRINGVDRGSIVALCMERCTELIISILAVLKAGAAYVPIDPNYPTHKIETILADTAAPVLIIKGKLPQELNYKSLIADLTEPESWFIGETGNPGEQASAEDLAYIIYTSGSTGNAKGVMIEHRSLVNRLLWMQEKYPIGYPDVIMQKTTYCFDVSVWEILLWSINGASVYLLGPGEEKNPKAIAEAIFKYKVTIIHFVPTMLQMFLTTVEQDKTVGKIASLKYVFCSGEALSFNNAEDFFKLFPKNHCPRLINKYGPTEATIDVTYYECTRNDVKKSIPIGKPINNIKLYIVDSEGRNQGIGALGELYLSGVGIARGYLNRSELTNSKFIKNPSLGDGICYKTGDIARWLPDGNVEYLGRNDSQIKIRGYRIELGEIEAASSRHQQITEAVALVRNISEDQKDICLYYSTRGTVSEEELKQHLSLYLPSYMLPARYVHMERMPVLPNGKINRKELPDAPAENIEQQEIILPHNKVEQTIYDIWKEVLKVECFSVITSFFSMGGDSIKAIRAVSLINTQLQADLSIVNLYENSTVSKLAEYILNSEPVSKKSVEISFSELNKIKKSISESDKKNILGSDNVEDFYPMSDIQLGMVLQSLKANDGAVYHDQHIVSFFDEDFQPDLVQRALDLMIQKHHILRTTYYLAGFFTQIQVIYKTIEAKLRVVPLQYLSAEQQTEEISSFMEKDREQPFIKSESEIQLPLWRMVFFQLSQKGDFALLLSIHHSVMDGWSVASFMTEFMNTYSKMKTLDTIPVSHLKHSYKDYITEQVNLIGDKRIQEFWKKELEGSKMCEFPELPIEDKTVLKEQQFEVYDLGTEKNNLLRKLAKEEGLSPRTICFAAYAFMLYITSYYTDFIVGLVENNRPLCEDGDKILGCFLNTVPVRVSIKKSMSWREFLRDFDRKMIQLKHYGRLPVSKIMEFSGNNSLNSSINNFFNFVDFHIYDQLEQKVQSDWKFEAEEYYKTEMPLDFICMHTKEKFFLKVSYSHENFAREQIQKYLVYFEKILQCMFENPDSPVSKTDILQQVYGNSIMQAHRGTQINYDGCDVISMFANEVTKHGQDTAIVFENREYTYSDVQRQADAVSTAVKKLGIESSNVIAIMIDRSPEMIIGMLGVLKAGCGYLPIDPGYPQSRIEYMLDNSDSAAIITNKKYAGQHFPMDRTIVMEECGCTSEKKDSAPFLYNMSDMAYMIYTSGSTGKPKGVIIDHCALSNFIAGMKQVLPFETGKTILSATTISFDIFVLESLTALCCGMKILLASKQEQLDPRLLSRMFEKQHINFLQITPSRLQLLLEDKNVSSGIGRLDAIMIGGENLSDSLAEKVKKTGNLRIFNMYGPTETTVWSTVKEITGLDKVTLGSPIANTQLYIIDDNNELQAPESPGELCISGDGLARGYCNAPELTNKKFIRSPFDKTVKIYKTGDIVRRLADGEFDYLGRLDNQVKIRGFRIELGEVETALMTYSGVKAAIVRPLTNEAGEVDLTAFYINDVQIPPEYFKESLSKILPDYMIPGNFIFLNEFPLMPNGKIDNSQLSALALQNVNSEVMLPGTETEKALLEIWCDVLHKQSISTTDNFFTIGGNSFLIVKVFSRISEELSNEITIADLFIYPTIISLGRFIDLKNTKPTKVSETKGIDVLPEYRLNSGISGSRTTLVLNIDESMLNRACKQITDVNGIDTVLAVGFIYLLYEISATEEIEVSVAAATGIVNVLVDFTKIQSLRQLSMITNQYLEETDNPERSSGLLQFTQKKNNRVYPYFANKENTQLYKVDENAFDLALTYLNYNNNLELSLSFNKAILRKEKMEKFLNGYVRLLNKIVLELQNGDE